jgi:poly(A) polymerase Pap1
MEGQVTSCVMKFTGANTNVLLVTPRHITRDHFFSSFYEILEENEEVKELRVTIVDIILRVLLAIYAKYFIGSMQFCPLNV